MQVTPIYMSSNEFLCESCWLPGTKLSLDIIRPVMHFIRICRAKSAITLVDKAMILQNVAVLHLPPPTRTQNWCYSAEFIRRLQYSFKKPGQFWISPILLWLVYSISKFFWFRRIRSNTINFMKRVQYSLMKLGRGGITHFHRGLFSGIILEAETDNYDEKNCTVPLWSSPGNVPRWTPASTKKTPIPHADIKAQKVPAKDPAHQYYSHQACGGWE